MATKKNPPPQVAELQNVIHGVAKNFVEKVYGPHGPAWGTQFSDIEELAVQIGRSVSRQMVDQALRRQAAEPVPAEDQVCPSCGKPVGLAGHEPRIVATRVGDAEWNEPLASCRRCRRAFFPSIETAGD
jgi:ribosomal protein S27AE